MNFIIINILIFALSVTLKAQNIKSNRTENKRKIERKGGEIRCEDDSGLAIDAIVVTADEKLLIFLDSNMVAMNTVSTNDTKYPVLDGLTKTSNLLPRFEGNITTAFTIGNVTHFLNDGLKLWSYDSIERKYTGPELRTNKFKCLKKDYQIESVLVIHPHHPHPHILVYHSENGSHFLTICNIKTGALQEKYKQTEDISATEILWKLDENIYEGVVVGKHFFNRFKIAPFSKNLNYIKLNGPMDDNQLLLGCPQNLCYDGEVDTIVSIPQGLTYVFRGIYFWKFSFENLTKTAFSVKDAQLINEVWPNFDDMEAAYCDGKFINFFKGGLVYHYDLSKKNGTMFFVEQMFNGLDFTEFDTVWFDKLNNELYFIKGYKYFIYNMRTELVSERGEIVIKSNKDTFYSRVKICAIVAASNGNTLIFLRDYVFVANSASLKQKTLRNPVLLQKYLFLCQTNYNYTLTPYKSFAGFERYMNAFLPLSITFKSIKSDNKTKDLHVHKHGPSLTKPKELLTEDEIENWKNDINELTVTEDEMPRWLVVTMFCVVPAFFVVVIVAAIVIIKQSRALRK